jgi:hypothetical protein
MLSTVCLRDVYLALRAMDDGPSLATCRTQDETSTVDRPFCAGSASDVFGLTNITNALATRHHALVG